MLKNLFDKITRGSLRFRWVTIALSVLLLAAGALALTQFNQELVPRSSSRKAWSWPFTMAPRRKRRWNR